MKVEANMESNGGYGGQNTAASTSSTPDSPSLYTDRHSRITKDNLFMILALWMERFPVSIPDEDPKPDKKVGAVLVLPNDILYAVDCTRDGVHGIARLLINHQHHMPKGCKVFVSRKPCSFCAKLLLQSKVERVFYLPFEPEYNDETKMLEVDILFKTSSVGQSLFVPKVEKAVLEDLKRRKRTEKTKGTEKTQLEETEETLRGFYWNDNWMQRAKEKLPWLALDQSMIIQVREGFESMTEWMARILVASNKADQFSPCRRSSQPEFDPVKKPLQRKQATHLIKMAEFLAERSDDPKTGVGAVIANKRMEIKALGWNGFPIKAPYGEYPRASHSDEVPEKKYPYVIHAEQNALLNRNDNLEDGILFVTKTPCDECTPLIEMQRIKTVVIDGDLQKKESQGNNLSYSKFAEKVSTGIFTCFERKAKFGGYNLRARKKVSKLGDI